MARRIRNQAVLWMLLWLVFSLAVAHRATAATYNFYFNNVEQEGDGTSATPTVTVTDPETGEQKEVVGEKADPAEESTTEEAAAPEPSTERSVEAPKERKRGSTRIITSAVGLAGKTQDPDPYGWSATPSAMGGFSAEFGWELGRHLGVNLLAGVLEEDAGSSEAFFGAEAEWFLIRNSQFQLEALLGGTSLAAADGNSASVHAGGRMTVGLFPDMGLSLGIRGNAGFTMAQAGLVFHL